MCIGLPEHFLSVQLTLPGIHDLTFTVSTTDRTPLITHIPHAPLLISMRKKS